MQRYLSLFLFIALTIGAGSVIGVINTPGPWYAELVKPSFNPPSWVFAPVWTLLYLLIAIAGWRIWMCAPDGIAMKLWFVQLALNLAWSPAFFGAEQPALALFVILLLTASITLFVFFARHADRLAALLFAPYLLWVGFAAVLNASIVLLN